MTTNNSEAVKPRGDKLSPFLVFHNLDEDSQFEVNPNIWKTTPQGFKLVALVHARDFDHAFQLTNHMDHAWWENPQVTLLVEPTQRSTSIGDVIIPLAEARMAAYYGFQRIYVEEGLSPIKLEGESSDK